MKDEIKEIIEQTHNPKGYSIEEAATHICALTGIGDDKCSHPRESRKYIGSNTLKCGLCGKEFK